VALSFQEADMLVSERMSHQVTSIPPDMPLVDALNLMKRERIRRTPVVKERSTDRRHLRQGSAQRLSFTNPGDERVGDELPGEQDHG